MNSCPTFTQLFVIIGNIRWYPSINREDIKKLKSEISETETKNRNCYIVLNNPQFYRDELNGSSGIWEFFDLNNLKLLSTITHENINIVYTVKSIKNKWDVEFFDEHDMNMFYLMNYIPLNSCSKKNINLLITTIFLVLESKKMSELHKHEIMVKQNRQKTRRHFFNATVLLLTTVGINLYFSYITSES